MPTSATPCEVSAMLRACSALTPAGLRSSLAVDVIVVVDTVNRSTRIAAAEVLYCAKNRPSVPTLHTSHGHTGR